MITEETAIKHLDIILDSMNVVGKFSVLDILTEKADFDWFKDNERTDFNQTKIEVERLGKMYGYLDPVNNRSGYFTLSEIGIEAKKKGGHLRFQKSLNKSSLTRYQKIYIPFFIIFGLIGSYKIILPSVSKSEYENLKSDFEILELKYDSIVKLTSKTPLKKLNDTLQTKSLKDLKTDR